MRKGYYLLAALLAAGLQMTGCSGSGQETEAANTQAETSAAAEETRGEENGSRDEESQAETQTSSSAETKEADQSQADETAGKETTEEETATEAATPEETTVLETEAETRAEVKHSGYLFQSGGVTIGMNEDVAVILNGLGAWSNYAESPSCAFKGLDKIYSYSGFDLYTYPIKNVDYVNSVYFTDDSVSTPEGIRIGSSEADMLAAYGDQYTEEYGVYTYTKEKSTLSFIITDGVVDSVEYVAITK